MDCQGTPPLMAVTVYFLIQWSTKALLVKGGSIPAGDSHA